MTADEWAYDPLPDAIAALAAGRHVILVDEQHSSHVDVNLLLAGEAADVESIRFMMHHGHGVVTARVSAARSDALALRPMTRGEVAIGAAMMMLPVRRDNDGRRPGSAEACADAMRALADPGSGPRSLAVPGSVFPHRAREGGILVRARSTEAAVELATLAGTEPVVAACELADDAGTPPPDRVRSLADAHGIPVVDIAAIARECMRNRRLVERLSEGPVPTPGGGFRGVAYGEPLTDKVHLALVRGTVAGATDVLVRVHSECLTGDVFHSLRCDCGEQLADALRRVQADPCGVVLYMAQEGRGIGLLDKLRAYELQDGGLDTVDANLALGLAVDQRDWGIAAQILLDLGLERIRLLTNNPSKTRGLENFGLIVTAQEPIEMVPNPMNAPYLAAKRDRLGHLLS